jgi:hypothetical protein
MYRPTPPAALPEGTPAEQAAWLIEKQFVQTSRKYRMLSRLPEGTDDPCQLLAETELKGVSFEKLSKEVSEYWRDHYPRWASGMGPKHAAKHWMACHSQKFEGCHIEVNQAVFNEYRKQGGDMWPWWLS